jgi:hypothetical protein
MTEQYVSTTTTDGLIRTIVVEAPDSDNSSKIDSPPLDVNGLLVAVAEGSVKDNMNHDWW